MEKEDMKLFEETVEFLKKISVTNNHNDDRNILSEAREKVQGVHRDLPDKISSQTGFAYFIIQDSKSAVIEELKYVCDQLSDLSIKADIKDYVASLLQHDDDCSSFVDDDVDVNVDVDDDDDDDDSDYDDGPVAEKSVYFKRKNILALEIEYYDHILKFIDKHFATPDKEERVSGSKYDPGLMILSQASCMIAFVRQDLFDCRNAVESSSVWAGKNLTLMITKSRSMVEAYLNSTHNKMTNPTLKEELARFIADLHPQMLPSEILDPSLDYTDGERMSNLDPSLDYTDGERMSNQSEMTAIELKPESCSGEVESDSGGCKSPIDLPENHETKDEHDDIDGYYHDHDKCIEEQEERDFPRFIRIGNWDPEYEGQGISLLDPSAPRHHFKDESVFLSMSVGSSKLLWREDEPDLTNMSEGSPKFPPEDEHDHANTSEGNLKG